jgi:uncharacterized protein GlcG (DUF336 family)
MAGVRRVGIKRRNAACQSNRLIHLTKEKFDMTFRNGSPTGIFSQRDWTCVGMKQSLLRLVMAALLIGLAGQSAAWAQGQTSSATGDGSSSAYRYTLPLALAVEAANEAIRVCTLHGYLVTATVVDMDGVTQVALRGDGATVHTRESSYDKAYTVVTLGPIFDFDTSGKFFDLVKVNPYAPRLASMTNVMALPGAVAFKGKGAIVAALGVGGAPGGDKDEVCAQAGVAKVADRLPN